MNIHTSLIIIAILFIFLNQVITSGLILFYNNIAEQFEELYCTFGGLVKTIWKIKYKVLIKTVIGVHIVITLSFLILLHLRKVAPYELLKFIYVAIITLCLNLIASISMLYYLYCKKNKRQRDRIMKIKGGRFGNVFYPIKLSFIPTLVSLVFLVSSPLLKELRLLEICSLLSLLFATALILRISFKGSRNYKLL